MTYDDSEKAQARSAVASFKCLLYGRPMQDAGERWGCRCGFFYKPLVPGSIPKKYRQEKVSIKRFCQVCGKVEVTGIKKFCVTCAKRRNRESYRKSKAKSRSRVQKTGFSPIGAEALTKPDLAGSYGSSGYPNCGKLSVGIPGPVA